MLRTGNYATDHFHHLRDGTMIPARTKAALAATRMHRVRLGNPNLAAGSAAQARAIDAVTTEGAQARAAGVLPFIEQTQAAARGTS